MMLSLTDPPFDPNTVTPGVFGFAMTAFIAVAVILLLWDMNRRVRRVRFRAEARERIAEELAGRADATAAAASGSAGAGAAASGGDDRGAAAPAVPDDSDASQHRTPPPA